MTSRFITVIATMIILLAGLAVIEAGPERIAIVSIHQKGTFAPASVSVFVRVPPAAENRGYVVEAESEQGSHSTFRQLEGDAANRPQQPVELRLSAGVYAIAAFLLDARGDVLARTAIRTVRVQCRGCDDRPPSED